MRMLLVLAVALALPQSLVAQQASPWDAFYGCWRSTDANGLAPLSCYLPVENDPIAVEQVMLVNGRVSQRSTVRADGEEHARNETTCRTVAQAQASPSTARIYTTDRSECGSRTQTTDGLLAISPRQELLRVYVVVYGEARALITERLYRVSSATLPQDVQAKLAAVDLQADVALRRAAQALDIAAIEEVAAMADVGVAEAWMVEATRDVEGFSVRRRDLERLVAQGVDTRLIDMAVVVANPDEFTAAFDRRANAFFGGDALAGWGDASCFQRLVNNWGPFGLGYWPSIFMGPVWLNGASDCVVAAYMRGLPFWAYQQGFWRTGGVDIWRYGYLDPALLPTRVVVRPVNDGDEFGRVQKGSGYTNRGSGDAGSAMPRGGSSSSATTRSGSSAASSDGGSSGGRTPSATATGTGRTAQPRNPNP